jgi:acyl dehydratase
MQLMQWMQAGNIRQKIHGQYTLEEAPKALQDMAGRKVQGKAVVVMRELQPPASKATSAPKPQATEQPESAPRPDGPLQLGSLDEVKAYLGKSIGRTDWMAITQEMINHFADATGDHQWIHVDEERAAHELPEGRCLAHGYMSLSLISKNVYELINLDNVRLSFNYGTNRVRFPQAVYAGDRLRMHATLDKLEPRADGGMLIGLSCTMEVEGKEKPACVAEVMSVVYIS